MSLTKCIAMAVIFRASVCPVAWATDDVPINRERVVDVAKSQHTELLSIARNEATEAAKLARSVLNARIDPSLSRSYATDRKGGIVFRSREERKSYAEGATKRAEEMKTEVKLAQQRKGLLIPMMRQPLEPGQVGRFEWLAEVVQVIDGKQLLCKLSTFAPADPRSGRDLVWVEGVDTSDVADEMKLSLGGRENVFLYQGTKSYHAVSGATSTVRSFRRLNDAESAEIRAFLLNLDETPAKTFGNEYPTIAGTWRESPTIVVTITQKGKELKALCNYVHDRDGEIRWKMTGNVSKDGQITGKLVHTKGPKTYGGQTRTGVLSSDGMTISGHAAFDGGGGHDFEWKLESAPAPSVVAVWETQWEFVDAHGKKVNDTATRVLYSNGSLGSPSSGDKWERNGQTITIRYANGAVDTWTVSKDGKSFQGRNNRKAEITGKLVPGG